MLSRLPRVLYTTKEVHLAIKFDEEMDNRRTLVGIMLDSGRVLLGGIDLKLKLTEEADLWL